MERRRRRRAILAGIRRKLCLLCRPRRNAKSGPDKVRRVQRQRLAEAQSHFERESQIILGFNYDLSKTESFGGRVVSSEGETNAYLAFRRSGNKGAEHC